jgi:hypothetical protein
MTKKSITLFFALSLVLMLSSCAPVTIDSNPPGAAVYSADGQTQLGTTPFNTSVLVREKSFIIRKKHYFDEPVTLDYNSARTVIVKSRPAPILVYSKPPAEIYSTGSTTPIGNTPMKIQVAESAATYTLKTKDYYDKDVTIDDDSVTPIVVELARRPIVDIAATPDGVEVYENGKLIGPAPVREEIESPRTFELRKEGYFTKSITLKGAPPYEASVELTPFPVITVSATPSDAKISREGGLVGTGSAQLTVGEKTVLKVSSDRYYTQSVTLTPESPAQISIALKAMPYVMINSDPSGAKVTINGKSVGTTPVEQLVEKETMIELSKDGFVTKASTLTGADKSVTVSLEAVPVSTNPPAMMSETPVTKPAVETEKMPIATETAPAAKANHLPLIIGIVVVAGVLAGLLIKRKKK